MTDDFINEEESKAKALWRRYGTPAVIVICLLFIAIAGWQYWQAHKQKGSFEAAEAYQKLAIIINNVNDDPNAIISQSQQLESAYPDTIYADLAAMEKAKQQVILKQYDAAILSLKKVVDSSANINLQAIAKLRMARIYIQQKKYDVAKQLLASLKPQGYAVSKNMFLGDIALLQKDNDLAKKYWQQALTAANSPDFKDIRGIIEMKIDNLNALKSMNKSAANITLPVGVEGPLSNKNKTNK
ncbi:MAG: YfgM family protein [Francisellaceae bacterium]